MRCFLIERWVASICAFASVCVGFWGYPTGLAAGVVLPPEVPFNVSAGHEDFLYITLKSERGESWLFYVDSGSSCTILDKSLEPKLGKGFGPGQTWGWEGIRAAGVYAAPHLYAGGTQLRTGHLVKTQDLKRMFPGHPVMGILGMDCLKHYCIQLDFSSCKMRFLASQDAAVYEVGDVFPLKMFLGMVWTRMDLLGVRARPFLDLGDPSDGALKGRLFDQLRQPQVVRTNDATTVSGRPWRDFRLASGAIAGHTYSNLTFWRCSRPWLPQNEIGLGFLARHSVTLDFPKRKMYLQRTEARPEADQGPRTIAWWITESPGYFQDPQWLGNRIIAAPNAHSLEESAAANELTLWWDPPCFVDVGEPNARLSVVQMPAGDYHLRVESELKRDAAGPQKVSYSLQVEGGRPTRRVNEVGTIFLLHDYNQRKEHMKVWSYILAQAGYQTVLVDLRGHGLSSGDVIGFGRYETGDLSQLLDLLLKRRSASQPVGVLGVGYGAEVAMHWAVRDPRVEALVAIAPYDRVEQALQRMAETAGHPVDSAVLGIALQRAAQQLGIDWQDLSGATALRRLTRPVFLVGGDSDRISTPNDLSRLEECMPAGSQKFIVSGADHLDLPNCYRELAQAVIDWFDAHLAERKTSEQ